MNKKYLKTIAWIFKVQWSTSKFSFAWSLIYSVITGVRPIAQTYVLASLVSSVGKVALNNGDTRSVYIWLISALLIELIGQLFNNFDRLIRSRFQQKMDLAMNEKFFVKMYELSQEQFDDQEFNTKLDRARDSLGELWRVTNEVSWTLSSMITFISATTAVVVVSPIFGLIIMLSSLPSAYIQVKQNKIREKMYKKIEPIDRVAYRTRWLLIDTNFMPEVRVMNAFKKMIKVWKTNMVKSNNITYKTDKRLFKYDMLVDSIQPVISFAANIYFFRLLVAGSLGLDKFIFLRGMLEQAVNGTASVSGSVQRMHELVLNLQNFSAVYDTEPAIPIGEVIVSKPLQIEFKNVSFSYPGSELLALDDVSFVINPGSKLALVGENGAGKSTIIKLLLRQYLPTKGQILVNGVDIKDIDPQSYYEAISNLSQDYLMINHLTIKDNLLIGIKDELSEPKIYNATDLVDATRFIKKLPNKLDTRLDNSFNDGSNLSGGQRQRLAVAGALLRNGDIIILDEPTSAVDAKAEYSIFNNIYKSHAGKTTLIVSHRFSTVRKAEKIIVMEAGKIVEYGSHEELLEYGGLYKEMFETQAEGYK